MTLKTLFDAVYFSDFDPILIDGIVYDSPQDVPESVLSRNVEAIYNTPDFIRIDLE